MGHSYRVIPLVVAATLPALLPHASRAADASPSKPAFTRAADGLQFDTGTLKGSLGARGKSIGLRPMTHAASGVQTAGAYGIFSPYRMLTSDARFGTAAWDWTSKAEVLSDGAAKVHWSPDDVHPLEMTGVYRWSADDTLDLRLTVKPQRDLQRFELFLASYFNGFPVSSACVGRPASAGGGWQFIEAVKDQGTWQTFPRDDAAAATFADGRWTRPPHPVTWKMMPRLAVPLALRRDAKSGLTAVLMARPGDCFAVSMPYGEEGHRSVYLSLFGGDLKAGQEASAAARLVLGKNITDDRAMGLYREFVKRGEAGR